MEITFIQLNELQLDTSHLIEFSNCQLSILGKADTGTIKKLKEAVLYIHSNFNSIKKQMVYESYYLSVNTNTKIAINFCTFVLGLKLHAVQIRKDNDIAIVICNDEYFFGHYIEGYFLSDWSYVGSYCC